MQEKKNLLLTHCRDLIYKDAFKLSYNQVKRIYTNYQINQKLDKYLTDLIERGERSYGENFVNDFINAKTEANRYYLLENIGVRIVSPNNKSVSKTSDPVANKAPEPKHNDISDLDIEEPKLQTYETYEDLFDAITNKHGWPEKEANKLLAETAIDPAIKAKAQEALNNMNTLAEKDTEELPKVSQEDTSEMPTIEEPPIPVQSEEPKPTVLKRFIEKLKDPKFRKKIIIGGVIIAVGVVSVALNPEMQQFFGDLISNFTGSPDQMMSSDIISQANVSDVTIGNNVDTVSSATSFDLNSIGEGTEVYQTQADALNNVNPLSGNEFMNIDQLEAMSPDREVIIDVTSLSPEEIDNLADSGYTFRGLNEGTYMGHFDSNTISDLAEQQMGRSR